MGHKHEMERFRSLTLFLICLQALYSTDAFTHWVVTENGRIQAKFGSHFYMRRPFDLVSLLDQEARLSDINTLSQELVKRKALIQENTENLKDASQVEAQVYSQVVDCYLAKKPLQDVDVYESFGTNGTNRLGVDLEFVEKYPSRDNEQVNLDCSKFMKLDFTIYAYEHLKTMIKRSNLTNYPEPSLQSLLPSTTLSLFARQIFQGLSANSSSWVYYNFATIYWRIIGDAPKAIECARRALRTVPRQYKDIPLLNLAGIFHQSRESEDAVVLLQAAIRHAADVPENYLALGHVYSALEEYQKSIDCYDKYLKLRPDPDVLSIKQATVCYDKLVTEFTNLLNSLKGMFAELHDYQYLQHKWLDLKERLTWEKASFEAQLTGYNKEKIGDLLTEKGERCIQTFSKNKPTISCDFTDQSPYTHFEDDHQFLDPLLQAIQSNIAHLNQQIMATMKEGSRNFKHQRDHNLANTVNKEYGPDLGMPPLLREKYPTSTPLKNNLYFDEKGWPKQEECEIWNLPIDKQEDLKIPVYLPPENKGYQITKMLSEYINVPEHEEHKLPWYPPNCGELEDKEDQLSEDFEILPNEDLRNTFLGYINKGNSEEAEIGQRIVTAMQKKSGPEWILTHLASLYWRVKMSAKNAVKCLLKHKTLVPKEHQDILLVSLASLTHQAGLVDQAITIANLAFKVNFVEPSTNFLLAILHKTNNNIILAMFYMKNVLRVEPNYQNGLAEKLLKIWACRQKLGSYESNLGRRRDGPVEGMCKESDVINGEGVVCSANGDQCKTASIHCVKTDYTPVQSKTKSQGTLTLKQNCNSKGKMEHKSFSILSESSDGIYVELSQLENMLLDQDDNVQTQNQPQTNLVLGDDSLSVTIDDFYTSYDKHTTFQVKDKTGTYRLSQKSCDTVFSNLKKFPATLLQLITSRNIDIAPYLKPLKQDQKNVRPFCKNSQSFPYRLIDTVLSKDIPNRPESSIYMWLGLMAGDREVSINELGAKIGVALQDNTTSWILATAAALYWRVVGNNKEAIICFRQSLSYAPSDKLDMPFFALADVLYRIGFYQEALQVAYRAVDQKPDFVLNHFMIANIHGGLGNVKMSISFYQSCLDVDPTFELARNRLLSIYCRLLFDENGNPRDPMDLA